MRDERRRVINIPEHIFKNRQWTRQTYNRLNSNKAHKENVKKPQIPIFYPVPAKFVADWD